MLEVGVEVTRAVTRVPSPPSDLEARGRGRRFWKKVYEDNDPTPAEEELLVEACRLLDELDVLRAEYLKRPFTSGSVGQRRENPAGAAARQGRAELRRILDQLGIDASAADVGEITGVISLNSRRAQKAALTR